MLFSSLLFLKKVFLFYCLCSSFGLFLRALGYIDWNVFLSIVIFSLLLLSDLLARFVSLSLISSFWYIFSNLRSV